ncbi:AI-2E family transporter [Planomicrobium sp. YIM 101495]|uniref:AI-2E family transporter n=1 Tax=Planomicrobium sp. YIM 101495 TaxID=2665160 RepID=UPI0012B908AF|nr:AI-2E family transporter [Planomicrobium sp. YIM 101495]MTD31375.1 AI-2E family transporter [Planomicrobium sp. YIM 101495]
MIPGVEYSIIQGLFAMVTNVIPFVGPFIGVAPAVIIAFFQNIYRLIKLRYPEMR